MKRLGIVVIVLLFFVTACKGGTSVKRGDTITEDNNIKNFNKILENSSTKIKKVEITLLDNALCYNIDAEELNEKERDVTFDIVCKVFSNREMFESMVKYSNLRVRIFDEKGKKIQYEYSSTKENAGKSWKLSDKVNKEEKDISISE